MTDLREAVDSGDLDRLIRLVDGLCAAREWDRVVELRDRCRHALERGLQLWPAAEYAEYRMALEAPGPYAAAVVTETAGRFALGPLWEVAGSTHSWAELRDHLPAGPARSLVAHERVMRGEDLTGDESIDTLVLELPLHLEPWEPSYPLAVYGSSEAAFASPLPAAMTESRLPAPGDALDDEVLSEALEAIALPWAEQSNGSVATAVVDGSAEQAISVLQTGEALLAAVDAEQALAWAAWAGASGGAYGRRRGAPMGRFAAWWLVVAAAGMDWPLAPESIGEVSSEIRWLRWEEPGATHGWSACLAGEHEGVGWALRAVDDHREEDALAE